MGIPENPEARPPTMSQQGLEMLGSINRALDSFNEKTGAITKELTELKVNFATLTGSVQAAKEAADRNSNKLDDLAKEINSISANMAGLAVKANFNIVTAIAAILTVVGTAFAITNSIGNITSRRYISPDPVQTQRAPAAPAAQAKP